MDVEDGVELGFRGLGERRIERGAGIVDQEIEAVAAPIGLQRLGDLTGEGREARDKAGVERQRDRLAADLRQFGDEAIGLGL